MPNLSDAEYRSEVDRFQALLSRYPEFDWLTLDAETLWWSLSKINSELRLPKSFILSWIEKGLVPIWRPIGDGKFDFEIARSSVVLHLGREHTGWYRQHQDQVS